MAIFFSVREHANGARTHIRLNQARRVTNIKKAKWNTGKIQTANENQGARDNFYVKTIVKHVKVFNMLYL